MPEAISKGSLVYVRYRDHVLFRNLSEPVKDPVERETVGWLTQENSEIMCIQHDRTIENSKTSSGAASGLLLLKNCILEIDALRLKNVPYGFLSPNGGLTSVECALHEEKRKTQPK